MVSDKVRVFGYTSGFNQIKDRVSEVFDFLVIKEIIFIILEQHFKIFDNKINNFGKQILIIFCLFKIFSFLRIGVGEWCEDIFSFLKRNNKRFKNKGKIFREKWSHFFKKIKNNFSKKYFSVIGKLETGLNFIKFLFRPGNEIKENFSKLRII